jgi:hypothetical protein
MFCIAYCPSRQPPDEPFREKFGLVVGEGGSRGDQWKLIPLVTADPQPGNFFLPQLGNMKELIINENVKEKLLSQEIRNRQILVVKKSYIVNGWVQYQHGLKDPAELYFIDDANIPHDFESVFSIPAFETIERLPIPGQFFPVIDPASPLGIYIEKSRIIEAIRHELSRSQGKGWVTVTIENVNRIILNQIMDTFPAQDGVTVIKKSAGIISKPIIERGTHSYEIQMKDAYIQINTVASLSLLRTLFNERMFWAVWNGDRGDMLRDGGVNYAVCTDAAENVVNGETSGYEITIGRISGNLRFHFVIDHRRMQRSMTDPDEVDPFNRPMYATPLEEEIVVNGITIPPYFIINGYLYERLRVVNRVEKLTDQQWRAQLERHEPLGQPRKVSRHKKNRIYKEVQAIRLTDKLQVSDEVFTFTPEDIAELPAANTEGVNVFSGLRGQWFSRQLLWHFAATDGADRDRGCLKWFSDVLEGRHWDRWKNERMLEDELQTYITAYSKNCPLVELNKVLAVFKLPGVNSREAFPKVLANAVQRAIA